MSILTRDMVESAARSRHHLVAGTLDQPVRSSWAEVHQQSLRIAAGLAALRVGPDRAVAVLASSATEVAPLAQAIWLRRASLTMLQQPTPRTDITVWLEDTARAIALIKADVLVVGAPFLATAAHLAGRGVPVCTVESLCRDGVLQLGDADHANEDDIAIRQLTSGSTGTPKAVEITHGNFTANAVAMVAALDIDVDDDVTVSWLPLSHDMGLIALLAVPMQMGVECVVVTPEQFLRRPLSWAELIDRHRGTITSGPNFAYSVLSRVLAVADSTELDLSSLRVAFNGAEPIDHHDMAEFLRVGECFGLRRSALTPAYGLAEATLAVSFAAVAEPPLVDRVSRRAVADLHRAEPAHDGDQHVQSVTCVGPPVKGMEVRISLDAKPLAPREIGAIEIRGAAVATRYLTSGGAVPIANAAGWVDTGDLGYLDDDGRLYVCGRSKDLIVVAGKNLYPHDIERAAERAEGVRRGCVVAVRVDAGREGFAVLAEVRAPAHDDGYAQIRRDVVNRVIGHVGHAPREVRLFPPGTLPKTASGKLRRDHARRLLLLTEV